MTIFDFLGERVAIYGAGKRGQQLYQQLTKGKKINGKRYSFKVVAWFDREAEEYQKKGYPVEKPEKATSVEYDQLVIAIWKKEMAEEIKKKLIGYGVPEEKIYWLYEL